MRTAIVASAPKQEARPVIAPGLSGAIQYLWLPALVLAGFQLASTTGLLNPVLFPPPLVVLRTAWEMSITGELPRILAATLVRYSLGSALGVAGGIACGLAMGFAPFIRRSLEPFVAALYATPKLTLLPLFMLLLGIGNASKITLIALVALIFMATQTMDAVRSIDRAYIEMARNYGARGFTLLRSVLFPAVVPQIFTGMRMALTRSLVMSLSLELVSGPDGIGTLIWTSWQTFATERLYVGILMSATLGIALHHGLAALERKVVCWKAES